MIDLKVGKMVFVVDGYTTIKKGEYQEIEKVGRKYFYLKGNRHRIKIESLRSEGNYPDVIYENKKEYELLIYKNKLRKKIRSAFAGYYDLIQKLNDEDLETISKIIDKYEGVK